MVHLTVCCDHVTYAFQSEFTLYSCMNIKELLAPNRRDISSLGDSNGTWTHNRSVRKWVVNNLAKLVNWLSCVVSICVYGAFDCMLLSCQYAFHCEFALYSCLNVKELLAGKRRHIWSLSDCNGSWTHNRLVHKQTLKHLVKLAKWLTCVVSTYLYGGFDCMLLSCQIRTSELIHTLYLRDCQGDPCSIKDAISEV